MKSDTPSPLAVGAKRHLEAAGIRYVFVGEELGARRTESECYIGDRADYGRIATLPKFRQGLDRLRQGSRQRCIALICAEKEPLDCHRTILICRYLRTEFGIMHILSDGSIEEHSQTEKRLVRHMDMSRTLFAPKVTNEQLIQGAYDGFGPGSTLAGSGRLSADGPVSRMAGFEPAAASRKCRDTVSRSTPSRLAIRRWDQPD